MGIFWTIAIIWTIIGVLSNWGYGHGNNNNDQNSNERNHDDYGDGYQDGYEDHDHNDYDDRDYW
jgi:hypothetical protein